MADLSGQSLGSYHLLRQIGRGGMGEVYLAEDREPTDDERQREVAIKVVRIAETTLSSNADAMRLFREGRLLIELAHPHILPIYHDGVSDDLLYLVMPYVPGGSLADAIHGRSQLQLDLPLEPHRVLEYVEQVADALAYVHERDVIHRDVKPGNVLIEVQSDGRWWLLLADFGIARRVDTTTREAHWHGTVAYMAPEQFRGEISPAADQYALGVLAFELLSGQVPWGMVPPAVRTLNPTVPAAVETVLLQALSVRPDQRFPSVTAFAGALREAIGPAATAVPSSPADEAVALPSHIVEAVAPPPPGEDDTVATGHALLADGRYVEAVTVFQRAVLQAPENVTSWLHLAYAHAQLSQWQEALAAAERVVELRPQSRTALRNKGLALFHLRRFEDALAAYDQIVAIDANYAAAWKGKGIALAKLKRYEESHDAYETGLALEADDADAWYDLGQVCVHLERYEAAAHAFDQAMRLNPRDKLARSNKAMSLLRALSQEGKTQEADRQAKEEAVVSANLAVGQNPADADAWCRLGDALYQLSRYKQALGAYDRAVILDAQKVNIWVNKGRTLLRLRHYEEVVDACERALAIDPSIAEAWGTQAIALFSLACYQEAATAYAHACALSPDYGVDADALPTGVHASERGDTMPDDKPPQPRDMSSQARTVDLHPTV